MQLFDGDSCCFMLFDETDHVISFISSWSIHEHSWTVITCFLMNIHLGKLKKKNTHLNYCKAIYLGMISHI